MAIQQLTTPIINPIAAFDAQNQHIIEFTVIGGAQVLGNRLVISNNQTGAVVYDAIQSSMKLEHVIPANTLSNGQYYNAIIYTIDSSNDQSNPSYAVPFYCFSQPTLSITNMPTTGLIQNGTYLFEGSYSQIEGESLNSYQFTLYNTNREILSQSSLIYYESDSSLSYSFSGMDNNVSYYIELSGQTVNNTKITTGLIFFTVRYLKPASFAICDLVNNCEDGYVQISSNIVAIDGVSEPTPPVYIDNKEVDLTREGSWVKWDTGFNIQNDFTLRAFGRNFDPYEPIITLKNNLDTDNIPNRIEMKWMIGDIIKSLPQYVPAQGFNVSLTDSKKGKINSFVIGGNSIQKIVPGTVLGEGESVRITDKTSIPVQINVNGNEYQETVQGEPGTTVSGEYIIINNVNVNKELSAKVNGNNKQETRSGKNLLDLVKFMSASETKNGLTFTNNGDGTFDLVGTATVGTTFDLMDLYAHNVIPKSGVNYSLYSSYPYSASQFNINVRCNFDGTTRYYVPTAVRAYTYSNCTVSKLAVYIPADITINATNVKVMFVESNTVDNNYEPYGVMPSPDYPSEVETVGKGYNLWGGFTFSKISNGITYRFNKDGTLDLSGTSTVTGSLYSNNTNDAINNNLLVTLGAGDYYVSGGQANIKLQVVTESGAIIGTTSTSTGNVTFTLNGTRKVFIRSQMAGTVDQVIPPTTIKILLIKGTTERQYQPYGKGSVTVGTSNKNELRYNLLTSRTTNGLTITNNNDGTYKINGTATAQTILAIDNLLLDTAKKYKLSGCPSGGSSSTYYIAGANYADYGNGSSYVVPNRSTNIAFSIVIQNGTICNNIIFKPMLSEIDSNIFEPHKGETITLPLQKEMLQGDSFEKVGGVWKEKHNWGKVVLDGSDDEGWSLEMSGTETYYYRTANIINADTNLRSNLKCNKYKYANILSSNTDNGIWVTTNYLRIRYGAEKTLTAFKNELVAAPAILYYPSAETEYIDCTPEQTTILNQLQSLTPYETTHIYSTDSLSPIFEVTYNKVTAMPSPEKPSEVKVVQGYNLANIADKRKTINGLDILIEKGVATINGTSTSNVFENLTDLISFPKGDYIIQAFNIEKISTTSPLVRFVSSQGTQIGSAANMNNYEATSGVNTFEEETTARLQLRIQSGTTLNNFIIKPQIVKDSIKQFSPYNNIEINTRNKNLYEGNMELGTISVSSGAESTSSSVIRTTKYINVSKNRNIYVIGSDNSVQTKGFRFYDKRRNYLGAASLTTNNIVNLDSITLTNQTSYFTNNSDICYMRFVITTNSDTSIKYAVMTEISDYVEYQGQTFNIPTQREMLTGDSFIKSEQWKEKHIWGKIILDGTEDIIYESSSKRFQVRNFTDNVAMASNRIQTFSNYFKYIPTGNADGGCFTFSSKIYLYNYACTSLQEFRTWLSINKPIIYYPLQEPELLNCTLEQTEVLNQLYNFQLYSDETNIWSDNDPSPIFKVNLISLPSPDLKSPIYNTGDNKNQLNINDFNIEYSQAYYQARDTGFELIPNNIYSFSFEYNINEESTELYYSIGYGEDSYEGDILESVQYTNQTSGINYSSFTVPSNLPSGKKLWIKFAKTVILADINVDIKKVSLTQGKEYQEYQSPNLYNIYLTKAETNLYNKSQTPYIITNNVNYTETLNGYNISLNNVGQESYLAIGLKDILETGSDYSIYYNFSGDISDFRLYATDKGSQTIVEQIAVDGNGKFVAPDGVYDLQMRFYLNNSTVGNNAEIWNIAIEKGNKTEFAIYNGETYPLVLDRQLRGIGIYKDIICMESINLLNPLTQNAIVEENTEFYFSQKGNINYNISYVNIEGNVISSSNIVNGIITTPANCHSITINNASGTDLVNNLVQISYGDREQVYYPYVSEPSLIKYITEKTLDGSEDWKLNGDVFYLESITDYQLRDNSPLCDYFRGIENVSVIGDLAEYNNVVTFNKRDSGDPGDKFYLKSSSFSTVADLKSWLQNNNVKLYYVKDVPTIESLDSDIINTLSNIQTNEPITSMFTDNNSIAELNFDYINNYAEDKTQNAYVLLKCYNENTMPYVIHSNYIDIPSDNEKVFIWLRRDNNLFDLKIENLGVDTSEQNNI